MSFSGLVDLKAVTATFDALDAALDNVVGLDCDALGTNEQFGLLERCERLRRPYPR